MKFVNEAEADNITRIRKEIQELERMNTRMRMNIQDLSKSPGIAAPDDKIKNTKKSIQAKIKGNNEKIEHLRKQIKSMKESHKMSLGKMYNTNN